VRATIRNAYSTNQREGIIMKVSAGSNATRLRRLIVSAAAVCALSAATQASSALAATYSVVGTQGTLHVRTSPTLAASKVGDLHDGTSIDIVCQTRGDQVMGSTMWDKIDSPVVGYVADWYTNTPVVNNPSPGLPPCPEVPPVDPSDLTPDDHGSDNPGTIVQPSVADVAERYNGQTNVPRAIARAWSVGPHWSGFCEAFVGLVTKGPRGRGYASAMADYRDHLKHGLIHQGVPPRGAVVYWNPTSSRGAGHVGISLGNGREISTYGFVGQNRPIQIHSYTHFPKYLGWARP
jgi:hypothetical protein